MMVTRHALIAAALIASVSMIAPAMAAGPHDRGPGTFMNQGPHAFGDPGATGGDAAMPLPEPGYANQGPHPMGNPGATGHLPPQRPAFSFGPANEGPHSLR